MDCLGFLLPLMIASGTKFLLIVIVGTYLEKKEKSFTGRLVCGWLIVYTYIIGVLLIMSATSSITRANLYLSLIVPIILLGFIKRNRIKCFFINMMENKKIAINISMVMAFALILYVAAHSLVYMDSTWDSHTYGITRILLFCQNKSLFVNMKTLMLNVFTNEWNGELNAVFYRTITNRNQGISFGNAENFFYGMLCIAYFFQQFKINQKIKWGYLLLIICQPILLAMSMTIKGDFLVTFLMILAYVYFHKFLKEKTNFYMVMLMMCLAMMAGAKISMVPFAGICGFLIFILSIGSWKSFIKGYFMSFVSILICCSRYWINLVFYSNPFMRVDAETEKAVISFRHLANNTLEILKTIFSFDSYLIHSTPKVSILNLDTGIVGAGIFTIGIFLIVLLIMKHRFFAKNLFYVPYCGSLIFFAMSVNWYDFSFRYYLPWFVLFELYVLVKLNDFITQKTKKYFQIILIIVAMLCTYDGIMISRQYPEITPYSYKEAMNKTALEREYAAHPDFIFSIHKFWDSIKNNKAVLLCSNLDCIDSYLFGEENSNTVVFCDKDELEKLAMTGKYDVVSISNIFDSACTESWLEQNGYTRFEPQLYYFMPELYGVKLFIRDSCLTDEHKISIEFGDGFDIEERNESMYWNWGTSDTGVIRITRKNEKIHTVSLEFTVVLPTANAQQDVLRVTRENEIIWESKISNNETISIPIYFEKDNSNTINLELFYSGTPVKETDGVRNLFYALYNPKGVVLN